jgi:hypothetical protein
MLETRIIPYAGWNNVLELKTTDLELLVTLDVGPRVISFKRHGEDNVFYQDPLSLGLSGGDQFRLYGGHRFWVAPEDKLKTYSPDNHKVTCDITQSQVTLTSPFETGYNVQKQIIIRPASNHNSIEIVHQLTNTGTETLKDVSIWALSVMREGGKGIIPLPPKLSHTEKVLPHYPIVMWPYSDMNDPRYKWMRHFITVYQDNSTTEPQKMGLFNTAGWAAYLYKNILFHKRFSANTTPGNVYPDMGCNFELFTNEAFLELESLSQLVTLEPGQSCKHGEIWSLLHIAPIGQREHDLVEAMAFVEKSLLS